MGVNPHEAGRAQASSLWGGPEQDPLGSTFSRKMAGVVLPVGSQPGHRFIILVAPATAGVARFSLCVS